MSTPTARGLRTTTRSWRHADKPGDNIILIDWDALAAQCPGACFAADGIHLNAAGQEYYADVIGDVTGR